MPQMMPMMWSLMLIFMLLIIILTTSFFYYTSLPQLPLLNFSLPLLSNSHQWYWLW